FQALPKATVKFGDQLIRVYGNTAVNSGYYTFSYTKDGETKSIPARYSLTYVKDGNDWKIVDHHSSAVPTPPKEARIAGELRPRRIKAQTRPASAAGSAARGGAASWSRLSWPPAAAPPYRNVEDGLKRKGRRAWRNCHPA